MLQARQHVLNGITNGVDTVEWDPETDEHTAAPFSAADLRGKAQCKAALQQELGFEVNHEVRRGVSQWVDECWLFSLRSSTRWVHMLGRIAAAWCCCHIGLESSYSWDQ